MKAIAFLAVAMLAGTLMAGTGNSILVDGGVTYSQAPTPSVQQLLATIKVQDAVIQWKPEVQYEERDVQVQVPPAIRLRSVPVVSSPSVQYTTPSVSVPTVAPTVTLSSPQVIQVPQVQQSVTQLSTPMTTQTYTAPPAVTYQTSPQVQYVNPCPGGVCPVPVDTRSIQYQPAALTIDGQTRQIDTPTRARFFIRRAFSTPNFR